VETGTSWRRIVELSAAIILLNASLTFESAWPTPGIRWRGLVSIELAVCVLALLAARRMSFSRRVIGWVALLWAMFVIGRYAEVTAAALYGREINLFWDLRFVPDVAAMLAAPAQLWIMVLAAAGVLLLVVLVYLVARWALQRVADAAARAGEGRALAALAAVVATLWAGQQLDLPYADNVRFSRPVTATYARQARLLASSLGGATSLGESPAMNSDLSQVQGADVFLMFIEAYGAVSYDRPEIVARLAADRAQFATAIAETNRSVVSAFVESPTFGGSSWLAHITLLSGIEVRTHDANALLMADTRGTLVTNFKQQGYRTVAVMPGLWQEWPEGRFYGFDEIYGGRRLDYRGPPFGWWDITDQFALARMDALEVNRSPRAPLFVFMPTISTHAPFTPTPPYQPDWRRVLTDQPYDDAEVDRAYLHQPDWMDLGPSYADALSYMYQSLTGYIRLQGDRDAVFVLIGDHQPAAAVSGEGASWDVPVHVIASRPAVLARLEAGGFRPGLTPLHPRLGPMHGLTPVLLTAFGDRPQAHIPSARETR
jgi:hypothetical protein